MQVGQAVEAYRYKILKCSATTQRWYLDKLATFSDWCQNEGLSLEDLRPHHVAMFLEVVKTRINPQKHIPISSYTVHGYAQVVKGFLTFCRDEDMGASERLRKIEMPVVDKKVIEAFTPEQIRAMFAACGSARYRWMLARDQAILSLLFDTGIRSGELLGLTLDCVHLEPYNAFIKVFGKGRKEREVGLGTRSRQLLHKYLSRYRRAHPDEKHVFLGRQGPMKQSGLDEMFERLEEKAHISGVRCSPHTCRHTFAVNYLKQGGNIKKLSILLGHGSVVVTEMYTASFRAHDAREDLSVLDNLNL